jgi:protein gp37
MSKNTKIQWCDSTVNPTMGCDGCELWDQKRKSCYAGIMHIRWNGGSPGYAPTFEDVTLFPGRMAEAARWSELRGKQRPDKPWLDDLPRLIFVSDMSDALSKAVTFDYIMDEVIANVASEQGQRHHWLWLTKRPKRMAEFSAWLRKRGIEWPSNVWAGTSITDQKTTSRIKHLLDVGNEETIRFLSVEPQVEEIDLEAWLPEVDWLIHGGESGHGARRFYLQWAASLIEQCRSHSVPYFLKQLGSHVVDGSGRLTFEDNHASNWSEWPKSVRVREMPSV